MSEPTKNYAPLRSSKRFGETKIGMRITKADLLKWVNSLPEDKAEMVKFVIAPRRNPSAANEFTMFEDTWQPTKENFQKMTQEAVKQFPPENDDVPF